MPLNLGGMRDSALRKHCVMERKAGSEARCSGDKKHSTGSMVVAAGFEILHLQPPDQEVAGVFGPLAVRAASTVWWCAMVATGGDRRVRT